MSVHGPVVAGSFYPGAPEDLEAMVSDLLAEAPVLDAPPPKAVILPHAGYRFSGAVAASGAIALGQGGDPPRRVVILGPSHRHAFRGVALPGTERFATPLGEVPVDARAVAGEPDVNVVPEAHAAEHAIEVELPFLQQRLTEFSIVPLVVGEISPERLSGLIERLWGGQETLFVISTDLSHFLSTSEAAEIDLATAEAIETTTPDNLGPREACGYRPLAAFLRVAAQRGMRLTRLALTHSGAVTGDESRVVGYGAWMAHDAEQARFAQQHRQALLRVAAQGLLSRARRGNPHTIDLKTFAHPLRTFAPAFVTLKMEGRLRGCIGSLVAHQPLVKDVLDNAIKAGFHDPRFKPLTEEAKIRACEIEIAVLSRPAPMTFESEADLRARLRPGIDGLVLRDGQRRATFLPKVWESLQTPEAFLAGLKVKAGLPRNHWSGSLTIERYVTETFRARIGPN